VTTLAEARAALVAAVGGSDAPIDPPAAYVFSNGTDFTGFPAPEWRFRVTCAVGYGGDDAGASAALAELVGAKLAVLVGLAGWRLDGVTPDTIRQIAGGDQLTADVTVATKVTL
jgi:hypothetical protein